MKRKLEPSNSKAKDEKVNDEKAAKQKAQLKADLIIQLQDLQDNFNNMEAINIKNLETLEICKPKLKLWKKRNVKP